MHQPLIQVYYHRKLKYLVNAKCIFQFAKYMFARTVFQIYSIVYHFLFSILWQTFWEPWHPLSFFEKQCFQTSQRDMLTMSLSSCSVVCMQALFHEKVDRNTVLAGLSYNNKYFQTKIKNIFHLIGITNFKIIVKYPLGSLHGIELKAMLWPT